MASSQWFNCRQPRPKAEVCLFCFPWCGGGTQFYARWGADFGENIEVIGVRYPGRETRRSEPPTTDLGELVKNIAEEIIHLYSDKKIAFFGHSLGVLVACEVALYLKTNYAKEPTHMFLSSSFAPHSKHRRADVVKENKGPLYKWSDTDLINRIKDHGGTPSNFTADLDFMRRMFLPLYRSDLQLGEDYDAQPEPESIPLTCPLTLYEGRSDTSHHLHEFSELTSGNVDTVFFVGRHFYLLKQENSRALKKTIISTLRGK